MININKEKCIGCLSCMDKCILGSIKEVDGKANFFAEKGCIKCMHCAIACPENAITYNNEEAIYDNAMPLMTEVFGDEIEGFLMSRRSYRNFSEKKVPREEIERALNVAAWAPSAKNQHPTKYYLIEGRPLIEKITGIIVNHIKATGNSPEIIEGLDRGFNMVFGSAQTVILAYARNNAINPQADTALALNYAELVLQAGGIGTCWSGYFSRFANEIEELRQMFPLPDNNSFYGSLLVGYPTEEYYYIPRRLKMADIIVKED